MFSQQAAEAAEALEDPGRLGQQQRQSQHQQRHQQLPQQQVEQSAETDERDGVAGAEASRPKRAPQRPAPAGACAVEPGSNRLNQPAYALLTLNMLFVRPTSIKTVFSTQVARPTGAGRGVRGGYGQR